MRAIQLRRPIKRLRGNDHTERDLFPKTLNAAKMVIGAGGGEEGNAAVEFRVDD